MYDVQVNYDWLIDYKYLWGTFMIISLEITSESSYLIFCVFVQEF